MFFIGGLFKWQENLKQWMVIPLLLATDAALRAALRKEAEGTTVFLVSQRTSSIRHADRIVVLDDGDVVGLGRHEDLLVSCRVYREIYDSQFKKEDVVNG